MVARWATPAAIAAHLGVSAETVRDWIRSGALPAFGTPLHYTDTEPRKTKRVNYRVHEKDLARFLEARRSGGAPLPALPARMFTRRR